MTEPESKPEKRYREPWETAPPPDAKTITWLRHLFPNWGRAQ
jgi:hypothetical protein